MIQIGNPAVSFLIDAIKECVPQDSFYSDFIKILIKIGDHRAKETLVCALKEKNYHFYGRKAVAGFLDKMGWKPDNIEEEAAYCIVKENWNRCAEIGGPAVDLLIADIGLHATPGVMDNFTKTLIKMGKSSVKSLINALSNKGETEKKLELMVKILLQIGDPIAVEPIISAFIDKESSLYSNTFAAEALGRFGDKKAIEPLVNILQSGSYPHRYKRGRIVSALDELGWKPDNSEAAAIYYIEKENIDQLIKIGTKAVNPLISRIEEERGRYYHTDLTKSNIINPTWAVTALGEIGDPLAIESLIECLNYSKCEAGRPMQKEAVKVLRKLTGKDIDDDYKKWREWFENNN